MAQFAILVVEDSSGFMSVLKRALSELEREAERSFRVRTTGVFDDAWNALEREGPWDLLVTDICLKPRPSQKMGLQLVEEAQRQRVPCIVVSGSKPYVSRADAVDCVRKYGAVDFIEKNVWDRNRFSTDVRTVLQSWDATSDAGPSTPSPPRAGRPVRRTAVQVDLVGFSKMANTLHAISGAKLVASLGDEVREFIDEALRRAGGSLREHLMKATGDGGILLFERADQAHDFATAVLRAAKAHNAGKAYEESRREFRIGAATGDLVIRQLAGGAFDGDGKALIDAARFEPVAQPGEFVIDEPTYELLSPANRLDYGEPEAISAKHGEQFVVRRLSLPS